MRKQNMKNLETEDTAFTLLIPHGFRIPDVAEKKQILEAYGLDHKYKTAFDMVKDRKNDRQILIEVKGTKKYLPMLPRGFFFGMTERETELAEALGGNYQFAMCSIAEELKHFVLLTLKELNTFIRYKRIQYQVTLIE